MRSLKLSRDERAIERSIHEFVPASQKELASIVQAIESKKKDAVLNIRVNRSDLEHLKQKASKLGVKYQSFISEILHRVAEI